MLAANPSDYWALICNPIQFTHAVRAHQPNAWPDGLLWQPEDLKVPAELVWILSLTDHELNRLLVGCAQAMSLPTIRHIISRSERDRVEQVLGTNWVALTTSQQVPALPDQDLHEEATRSLLSGEQSPSFCATGFIAAIYTAFGPIWRHSLRQRIAPELESALDVPSISRSTAFGRALWLHESVWPFACAADKTFNGQS